MNFDCKNENNLMNVVMIGPTPCIIILLPVLLLLFTFKMNFDCKNENNLMNVVMIGPTPCIIILLPVLLLLFTFKMNFDCKNENNLMNVVMIDTKKHSMKNNDKYKSAAIPFC